MLFALGIFCLATVSTVFGEKMHERMSAERLAQIIQNTRNSASDYEIVRFNAPRLNKRDSKSSQRLTANVFGNDVKLWLQPSDGVLAGKNTPVYTAKRDPKTKRVNYKEIPNAMKNMGKFLVDPVQKASMLVTTDSKGQYSMNGFIGSKNLVVRSLPESMSFDFMQNRSLDDPELSENSRTTRSAYHVVFKREEKHSEKSHKILRLADTRSRVSKRSSPPEVVYPEMMIVVDYNLYALTGKSIQKALIYVLTFWNGVDLLYRSLEGPKFRFNIARIIIAEEHKATPYISENMYDDELIDAYSAHEEAQMYYYSILDVFPSSGYDAVATMTSLDMTSGDGDVDTLGIAAQGGACFVDNRKRAMRNVMILTDDGTFHGITTAAHEFAHLLNATHDDKPECKGEDGYLMTEDTTITENSHDFSECTIKEIEQFLRLNRGVCMYNKPITTDPLPRGLLPGQRSDRDHQCESLSRGKSCYTGAPKQLRCSAIYCLEPNTRNPECSINKSFAPPDGAFCDVGKVCLHGKCVKL